MSSEPVHPLDPNRGNDEAEREHFVEGTVARPPSFRMLLGFAAVVVAIYQAGQWLLDVWHFLRR